LSIHKFRRLWHDTNRVNGLRHAGYWHECRGIPFVIKDKKNGLLVELKSSEDIAKAINLISDNVAANKFKEHCILTTKEKVDWGLSVEKFERLLSNPGKKIGVFHDNLLERGGAEKLAIDLRIILMQI